METLKKQKLLILVVLLALTGLILWIIHAPSIGTSIDYKLWAINNCRQTHAPTSFDSAFDAAGPLTCDKSLDVPLIRNLIYWGVVDILAAITIGIAVVLDRQFSKRGK